MEILQDTNILDQNDDWSDMDMAEEGAMAHTPGGWAVDTTVAELGEVISSHAFTYHHVGSCVRTVFKKNTCSCKRLNARAT
jgi:hypothetical protein